MLTYRKYEKLNKLLWIIFVAGMYALLSTSILSWAMPNESTKVLGQVSTSNFLTGVSYTQASFEFGANSTAVSDGKSEVLKSTHFINQHIMGFGPGNPNPSPGSYNWNSLDNRFNGTMSGARGFVLTACCAPSWMKGGEPDFGSGFEVAPEEAYYDEYADLIAEAVDRYPQIEYVQVWNEMKGFWNSSLNRWNYEGYTDMYNLIWQRVKAVRPSVKIGGPYVVVNTNGGGKSFDSSLSGDFGTFDQRDLDVIEYWLQNKLGADFIAIDGKNSNKDGVELVDVFDRSDKFQVIHDWIRGLNNSTYPGAASLPIWWAEWYARTGNDTDSELFKNAVMSDALIKTVKSGAETALIWGNEGDSEGNYHPLALTTDTQNSGGGQPTLFQDTQNWVDDYFSNGTNLIAANSSNNSVTTLASSSKLMLVNTENSVQSTSVLGENFTLQPYQVSLEDTPDEYEEEDSGQEEVSNSPQESEDDAEDEESFNVVLTGPNGEELTIESIEEPVEVVDPETGEKLTKIVLPSGEIQYIDEDNNIVTPSFVDNDQGDASKKSIPVEPDAGLFSNQTIRSIQLAGVSFTVLSGVFFVAFNREYLLIGLRSLIDKIHHTHI